MMLFWPSVAAVGFLVLAALVVALAQSSTERYEFERNQVQGQRQQAAVPVGAAAAAAAQPVAEPAQAATGTADAQDAPLEQRSAVGVATHPAGKRLAEPGEVAAWWLVDDRPGLAGQYVVAGPFTDRLEADWAAVSGDEESSLRAVYGVQRDDGRVVRRQLPAERAWLSDLSDQLDRLPTEWDELLPDDEDDALVTLVVEVAAALVEAGLTLHDCAGDVPAGGVCLAPEPGRRGVLVSWSPHDRISRDQVHGPTVGAAVQRRLNTALADCLREFGFAVEPFGTTGCCLVPTEQE